LLALGPTTEFSDKLLDGLTRDLDSSTFDGQRRSWQSKPVDELTDVDIDTFLADF
jgi:hypothetical protein